MQATLRPSLPCPSSSCAWEAGYSEHIRVATGETVDQNGWGRERDKRLCLWEVRRVHLLVPSEFLCYFVCTSLALSHLKLPKIFYSFTYCLEFKKGSLNAGFGDCLNLWFVSQSCLWAVQE